MPLRLEVDPPHLAQKWLFYGDSLTAGYFAFGRLFEPYALALGRALPESPELWVVGLSGLSAVELVEMKASKEIKDAVRRTGPGIDARVFINFSQFLWVFRDFVGFSIVCALFFIGFGSVLN